MENSIEKFGSTFDENNIKTTVSEESISLAESELNIKFPTSYLSLIQEFGFPSTPKILDIIDRKNIEEFTDIQEFWTFEKIISDKKDGETSELEEDLIPFASDCLENLYFFKAEDLKTKTEDAPVYIFDIEFEYIEEVGESFIQFLEKYINM